MDNRINEDLFEYEKAHASFLRTCNEMEVSKEVNQVLLQTLLDKDLLAINEKCLKIADFGCGPANTIIAYLRNVNFTSSLDIRATDINPKYAGSSTGDDTANGEQSKVLGLAEQTLLNAKNSQILPLKCCSVKQGDAFKANDVLGLLSMDKDTEKEKNTFSLAYASHFFYYTYVHGASMLDMTKRFLNTIVTDILSENGLALIIHNGIKPRSVDLMFYRYAAKLIKDFNPSREEYSQFSPDSLIETCCQQLGLTVYSYDLVNRAKLDFSDQVFDYEHVFKNPNRYDELRESAVAVDDLYKMLFFAQKSPNELYLDKSHLGLTNLVDETLKILKTDGCVHSYLTLQMIFSKKASAKFKEDVASALQTLQGSLQLRNTIQ